jgi:hypothetical protein
MDRPPVPADMTARWARDYQTWFQHLKEAIKAGLNPRLTPGTRLTNFLTARIFPIVSAAVGGMRHGLKISLPQRGLHY